MQTDLPKTLIILTPGFPADENDSTCIPPQQVFVRTLQQTHPQLKVIVLTFQYPFFAGRYLWNGIEVVAFGGKGKGKIYRQVTWLKVVRYLRNLNKQYQIIGLLSFWLDECALIGSRFAKLKGIKHLCWILGQDAKAGNKYAQQMKPKADELIALSDFIVKEYSKNYGVSPAHVIPVGVDTTLFGEGAKERGIDILGVGSLIPLKQFDVFVKMVSLIKESRYNIQAVICGKGPECERLLAIIKTLGLEENIKLVGELPHHEALALMQRSKLLLHTSVYEGFGAVCLEALYAGASVVSFVKPMDAPIPNWHIAINEDDMLQKVETILDMPQPDHKPVLPYPIAYNGKAMMKLFGYNEAAIS
ncbi:glycosyltransferase family 4 protein [Mucilaginibacter sp.]|jgi:glycosyltransferase involved in cell wall biosynthesis|uniref:glycosyltransferase family 4 protein n=1 Tax=Mucilaginibacter sp. TaxID=1882438 RepID=UPI003562657C